MLLHRLSRDVTRLQGNISLCTKLLLHGMLCMLVVWRGYAFADDDRPATRQVLIAADFTACVIKPSQTLPLMYRSCYLFQACLLSIYGRARSCRGITRSGRATPEKPRCMPCVMLVPCT